MKPSPSPAAMDPMSPKDRESFNRIGQEYLAVVKVLTDAGMSEEKAKGVLAVLAKANWLTITADEYEQLTDLRDKLTPSQSDVEAARQILLLVTDCIPNDTLKRAASLLASRGTRALTPRMKAAVTLARNHSGEDLSALLIADLLKAIDRLTGEPSA